MTTSSPAGWTQTTERRVQFGLALGAVLVFARAFTAGFVGYDDPEYVAANPHVLGGLSLANVAWAFTAFYAANWHPLTWISLQLDVSLFGLKPQAMHAVNVLFHAANTLLVYRFVKNAFGRQAEAAWVAALFAVHPLHVESVAWITERKDVLSTYFGLLSLDAYLRWARGSRRDAAWTFGWLALGLLAKPMLVTWPCVFLLLDAWPLERKLNVREKLPFFGLVAAVAATTVYVQGKTGAVASPTPYELGEQALNAVRGYGWYLFETVVPIGLAPYHPFPGRAGGEPLSALEVAGSAALLVAISWAALKGKSRQLRFGWLWYLGTLVPVIGVVRVGSAAVAERYHYVPSIGLFLGLVFVASDWVQRRPRWRSAAIDLGALAVAGFAALTWVQLGYWQTEEKLFARALEVHPNAAVMHFNYAATLYEQGRGDEAAAHYRKAIELQPDDALARFNLGHLLHALKRDAEAEDVLRALLKQHPEHVEGRFKLAQVLLALGRREEAAAAFREVVERDPKHVGGLHGLAVLALVDGNVAEAVSLSERAVALSNRQEVPPLLVYADALRLAGNLEAADAALEEAAALAEKKGGGREAAQLRTRRGAR